MDIPNYIKDELEEIKDKVAKTYEGNRHNYERYNEFMRFTFQSSLTSDDIALLDDMGRPALQFNVGESYISRLCGEFSKQEAAFEVSSDDEDKADPVSIHVVQQHLNHVVLGSDNDQTRYEIYREMLSGGYSVAKVFHDYVNNRDFKQGIFYERCDDPTMVGFDLMARKANKGDGEFCFELKAYTKQQFENMFPNVDLRDVTFDGSFSAFKWSYLNGGQKVILVCDFYKKKKKNKRIYQLSDNSVISADEYKQMKKDYESGNMYVPMLNIKDKRWVKEEKICRYRLIESEILEYTETDYEKFPLVFFDGNSIPLRNSTNNTAIQQFTRPYLYQTKDSQRLKNFAGISIANSIENDVQHKFMVAIEALPNQRDLYESFVNFQRPNTMLFNAFYEKNPNQPIPNPIQPVPRIPAPPEISQAFVQADSLFQNILGSFDASLGINDNQLSGVAIIEAATQSNAAAMPYLVNFLAGMQRVGECILNLIPKFYTTPRSIPVKGPDGKAMYVKINTDDGVKMDYDSNFLNVRIKAGPSFAIQKARAYNQLIAMQQANPKFAQFMGDEGIDLMLDNVDMKGIDELKQRVKQWQQKQAMKEQAMMQAQQQQMANNPQMIRNQIEMQKIAQKNKEMEMEQQENMIQHKIDFERIKNDQMKMLTESELSRDDNLTQRLKAHTEAISNQMEHALKARDIGHRHGIEKVKTYHMINNTTQ